MNTPVDYELKGATPYSGEENNSPELTMRLHICAQMVEVVQECFRECQGMTALSMEESDRYWELADLLMRLEAKRSGIPIFRKD